jgi:hypothetical protein
MEECNELAKVASKSARFSPESDYDGITNRVKLQNEYNDLLAMIDLLHSEIGVVMTRDEALVQAKKEKFENMLLDSKQLGTLGND